jgi:hypothetical protein
MTDPSETPKFIACCEEGCRLSAYKIIDDDPYCERHILDEVIRRIEKIQSAYVSSSITTELRYDDE